MRKFRGLCIAGALASAPGCGEGADEDGGLLTSVPGLTTAPGSADGDWIMAGHDIEASFHNSAEGQLGPSRASALDVAWVFDQAAAGGPVGPIHATPVVVGDSVYVGDMFGQFFAIDPTGALAWRALTLPPSPLQHALGLGTPIGGSVETTSSPVVGGAVASKKYGLVILGDASGSLYALDLATGAPAWTLPYHDEHPLGGVFGNSLLLKDEDTVVVGFASLENFALMLAQSQPEGYTCCSHTGRVVALDVATGTELWRYDALPRAGVELLPAALAPFQLGPSGADVWGQPSYDAESETIFIGTGQNFSPATDSSTPASDSIIALDATNGSDRWRTQLITADLWVLGLPIPQNGRFLDQDVGDSPKLYLTSDGRKVLGAGLKNGGYYELDRQTGQVLSYVQHLQQANGLGGFQQGGGQADGVIFQHGLRGLDATGMGPFLGTVLALSQSDTRVLWRFERPSSPFAGSLAIADGVVYVVSPVEETVPEPPRHALYALDAATGEVLFRGDAPGRAIASPVVSRGRVYVSFGNSAVAALGLNLFGGIRCFMSAPP